VMLHPLAYVENSPEAKEQVYNWFLPSERALAAMCRNAGFAEVELIEEKSDRAVIVCRKKPGNAAAPAALKHFVAALKLKEAPQTARPSAEIILRLQAENVGLARWPASGDEGTDKGAVHLGSHLLTESEEEIDWDYGRARLPHDLEPGEAVDLELKVRLPGIPGKYIVEFDMVAEHVTWFEDHGSGTLRHEIVVD
jgi:hypothetical protein